MKLKFTLLSIAFSTIGCLNAQTGFNTTAVNWTLPQGGYLSSIAAQGFNAIADGSTGNIDGDQTWTTMDINGDGKPDLVVTSQEVTIGNYGVDTVFGLPSTPHWKVYLNNGNGYNTTAINWTLPQGGYLSSIAAHGFNAIADGDTGNIDGDQTWTVMDMNGDSKPDLVVTSQEVTIGNYGVDTAFGVPSTPYWKVYLNSGTGFATTAVNWTLPQGGYLSSITAHGFNAIADGSTGNMDGDQTWTVMDMNGDRKPDLVVTSQEVTIGNYGVDTAFGVPSTPHWKVYLNSGTGFATTAVNWTLPQGGYLSSITAHGFNAIADGSTGNMDGDQTWTVMDMNGDSKPDLVVTSQEVTIGNYGVDTAFGVPSTPHWKVYLNSGTGFATTAVNWTLPQGGYLSSITAHGFNAIADGSTGNMDGDQTWTVMDMNGDSKPDLVVTSQEVTIGNYGVDTAFGVPSTPHWKVYLNSGTGFATTAVNWTLPQGGYLSSITAHGFNAIADGSTGNMDGDQTWTVMDMNGDRKPDLVVTSQEVTIGNYGVDTAFGVPSTPHWKVYLNSGTGFATTAVNWTLPQGGYLSSITAHGFNAIADGSTGNMDGDQTWTVMDMNGDSKPDLVVTSQEVTIGNYGVDTVFGLPSTPYWKVYLTGSTLGTDLFTANKKEIVVYPNPSNGKFLIKAETENINVVITDLAGRTVLNQNGTTIDLSGYPQGVYLMNIQIEDEMFVKKIILE